MPPAAILVQNLGKRYRIGQIERYGTLRDTIARMATAPAARIHASLSGNADTQAGRRSKRYIWALQNVSLQINQGEAVGIIGPNGAGKTTLLKILSRITEPTEGMAQIRGRVSSLLEVGTGFHQELTGRENVYLNGAILGMRKKEIDARFDEIVSFAEVDKFIDTPVKRYSDGMRVRLGFAVAAHLEPDIMLVDEVLAVGDAAFQRKCLGKMGDAVSEGRTVLLVSHNMAAIQNLCSIAYALDHGRVLASGDVNEVISQYLDSTSRPEATSIADRTDRLGNGKMRVTGFSVSGAANSQTAVQCGRSVTFEIAYEGRPPLRNVDIEMLFYNQFGACILVTGASWVGKLFDEVPERGTFLCHFDKFPLMPGIYHLRFDCTVNGIETDVIKNAVTLQVVEGDYYGSGRLPPKGYGEIAVSHDWDIRPSARASDNLIKN